MGHKIALPHHLRKGFYLNFLTLIFFLSNQSCIIFPDYHSYIVHFYSEVSVCFHMVPWYMSRAASSSASSCILLCGAGMQAHTSILTVTNIHRDAYMWFNHCRWSVTSSPRHLSVWGGRLQWVGLFRKLVGAVGGGDLYRKWDTASGPGGFRHSSSSCLLYTSWLR